MSGSQKPFLILHEGVNDQTKQAQKKLPKRNKGKRHKSAFSRQLEVFLKQGDRNYAVYMPMHELWEAYISRVLGDSQGLVAAQSLLSADWHGALISVSRAKNPSLVGLSGIVLWESRGQWLVVTESQGFKKILKSGSIVDIICPGGVTYAVVGNRVLCRSSERTTRKFKPHDVASVAPLLLSLLLRGD